MVKNKDLISSLVSLLCGLFLLMFFLSMHFSSHPVSFIDFKVYVQSYEDYQSGKNIYARFLNTFPKEDPTGKYFAYLPPFVFIGGLLSLIEFPYNLFLFQCFSFLCFYASIFLLFRFFTRFKNIFHQFLFSSFLLFSFPFQYTFALGQINAYLLLLLTLFLVAVKKEKFFAAPLFLFPVAALKFFPSLLFLSLLKNKKSAFSLALFLSACFAAVLLFCFPSESGVFFREVMPRRFSLVGNAANQSLLLFLSKAGISSFYAYVVIFPALVFSFARFNSTLSFCFFILPFSFLFTPLSWIHHYIFLYPSHFYYMNKDGKVKFFAALSLFFVFIPPLKSSVFLLSFPPFYGLLLLLATAFLENEAKKAQQ